MDLPFGTVLKAERDRLGLSRSTVAARAGVTEASVGHWERGRNMPRRAELEKLIEIFGPDSPIAGLMPRNHVVLRQEVHDLWQDFRRENMRRALSNEPPAPLPRTTAQKIDHFAFASSFDLREDDAPDRVSVVDLLKLKLPGRAENCGVRKSAGAYDISADYLDEDILVAVTTSFATRHIRAQFDRALHKIDRTMRIISQTRDLPIPHIKVVLMIGPEAIPASMRRDIELECALYKVDFDVVADEGAAADRIAMLCETGHFYPPTDDE